MPFFVNIANILQKVKSKMSHVWSLLNCIGNYLPFSSTVIRHSIKEVPPVRASVPKG